MSDDKEIRSDAKLKNLPAEALEDLWRFRYPEEGGEKLTLEAIAVEIPLRYGFTVALSTVSDFYAWLRHKRRMDSAVARAEQAKLDYAKQNPAASLTELEEYGQFVFTNETIENRDTLNFARLRKLRLQERALDHDARRIELLEQKAQAADAAQVEIAKLRDPSAGLSASERQAIIDKVDEILGLKS